MGTVIDCAESIYDIMAICTKFLLDTNFDPWEFDNNSYIYNTVFDAVEKYADKVERNTHTYELRLLKKQLNKLLADSNNSIEQWNNVCYSIVKSIDDCVEPDVENNSVKDGYCLRYESLNSREKECVRIIPRQNDTFIKQNGRLLLKDPHNSNYTLFRNENDFFASDIDRKMQNYMIWGKEYINKYPLNIVRIDKNSDIGKAFYNKKSLKIGIAPFTCMEINDILNIQKNRTTFLVKNMKKNAEEKLKERYIKVYKKCCEQDIDFLIFPEMLISYVMLDECKKNYTKSGPKYVINGSISDMRTNVSVITDYNRKDIFSYYKKNGYIDTIQGINYKEALDNSQNIDYSILELEDFGRVGICICKDLNDENTVLFHKLIRTNILLVPAFSKSLSLISEAENIADRYNCITVFANSCSARCKHWDDNMDIGFIVLPAKKGTSNKCLVHKYSAKNCINTCENECLCKVFSIVFDEISECEGKYSFNLQEEILS